MPVVTRFAPSPTGYLHLGHAYAAIFAHDAAKASGGKFLLRIEDIDAARCRPAFETAIEEDLAWLGLDWERPVRRQSDHMGEYRAALDRLRDAGLLYPCFCTRAEIRAEIERAADAPQGPDGPIYPGICRALTAAERAERIDRGDSYALRLDVAAAKARTGILGWTDRALGTVTAAPEQFGDVVLARKDTPASYHLAVTLDDALQGVTLVTRGEDLAPATHIHRLLQALLGLPVPEYRHHRILTDSTGRRLAKRDQGTTLRILRAAGRTPADIRRMAGLA
jgi:glutamyl-Q tRNA(Asp) synthetase